MGPTPILTIPKSVIGREELVVLFKRDFERMQEEIRRKSPVTFRGYETTNWNGKKYKVPAYQLHGKAAERLDREVVEALKEYKDGKTKKIKSLADLD